MVVVVSKLPLGVAVSEELDVPVTVNAYFFKKWRYEAGDGWRDAPLLIGRTLQIESVGVAPVDGISHLFSNDLVIGAIVLFGTTIGLMVALAWWYRRGDRRVRAL